MQKPNIPINSNDDDTYQYRGQYGDSDIFGASVPSSIHQNFLEYYHGKRTFLTPFDSDILTNPNLPATSNFTYLPDGTILKSPKFDNPTIFTQEIIPSNFSANDYNQNIQRKKQISSTQLYNDQDNMFILRDISKKQTNGTGSLSSSGIPFFYF